MAGHSAKQIITAFNLLSQPCGTTVSELGKRLGIEKRQVYRVIDAIQDHFRFAVTKDKAVVGGEVRYYLDKEQSKRLSDMRIADLNLTIAEIIALYFLKGHAKLYRGTGIENEIERAFVKLDAFVPPGFAKRLDKVKSIFLPTVKFAKDYTAKQDIIENLTDAILEQKTCLVEYHAFSDNAIKHFKIDPLKFFENDGGLYLFVRATSFGHIRVLAVERINDLTKSDESFEYPTDFEPEKLLEDSFGLVYDDPIHVKIRFSADQARYIQERRWAKKQRIYRRKDGSIVLSMDTSGWWDLHRWVLSFGPAAEVLEPVELRENIRSDVARMLQIYEVQS